MSIFTAAANDEDGDTIKQLRETAIRWAARAEQAEKMLEAIGAGGVGKQEQSQAEQPIGCITGTYGGYPVVRLNDPALVLPFGTALYTHPQPKRKPLTDEEILKLAYPLRWDEVDDFEADRAINFAQTIERAHGIGGGEK